MRDAGAPRKFTNVYVKNFSSEWDNDRLKKEFEVFGEIQSTKVMTDEENKGRGFGFVAFQEPESAEKVSFDKMTLFVSVRAVC